MNKYSRSDSNQGDINLNESNQFTLKGEDEVYESTPKLDSSIFFIEQNKKNNASSHPIQINNLINFSFSKHNPNTQEKKIYFNNGKDINNISIIPRERKYKSIVKVTFTKSRKKINKKRKEKSSKSLPPNETRENMIYINNENEQNEQNHISIENEPSPIKETQNYKQKEKSNSNIIEKNFENIVEYIENDDIKSEDMSNPLALDINFDFNSKENERRFLSCENNDISYINISKDKEMSNNELNIYNNSNNKNEKNKLKNNKELEIKFPIKEYENFFEEEDKTKDYNNILSKLNNGNKNEINKNNEFYKNKLSIDQKISFQNNNNDKGKFSFVNDNSNEIEKINIIYLDIDSGIESIHKEVHNNNKNKNSNKGNSLNNSYNINKDNNCNDNRDNCSNKKYENKAKNDSNNDEVFIKCKNFLTQIYYNKNKGKAIITNSQVDKNNEKEKYITLNDEEEILNENEKKFEEEDKEEIIEEKDEKIEKKEKDKEMEIRIELLDDDYYDDKKTNKIIDKTYISYEKEKEKEEISQLDKEKQKKQNLNIESKSKNNEVPILEENKNENPDNSIIEEIIEIKDSSKKVEISKYKIKEDKERIKEIKKEKGKYNIINIKEEDDSEIYGIKSEKINKNADKNFFEKLKLQLKKEIYSDLINNGSLSPKSNQNITKLKKEAIALKEPDSIDNSYSEEDHKYKNKAFLGKKRESTTSFKIDHSIEDNYINDITRLPEICLNKNRNNNFYKNELINGNTFGGNDDLERTIIKSIENCALNWIYEKIITKSFSSSIELDRKIMEIIKTRGYSNVISSLNNYRKNQILSIEEEENNSNEIEINKKYQKEYHFNVINDFYYRYKCINIKQNIQKYVCCGKDCSGLAELNLIEKKFIIIQKHSIPPKFHTKFNDDKPIKFMKKRKLEEIHIKLNDHNDKFHMEWFK